MKNKILTERQVRNRSIIAGILALLIGLVWDYFQYKTLSFGTVFWNIVESVAFVIFMNIFRDCKIVCVRMNDSLNLFL